MSSYSRTNCNIRNPHQSRTTFSSKTKTKTKTKTRQDKVQMHVPKGAFSVQRGRVHRFQRFASKIKLEDKNEFRKNEHSGIQLNLATIPCFYTILHRARPFLHWQFITPFPPEQCTLHKMLGFCRRNANKANPLVMQCVDIQPPAQMEREKGSCRTSRLSFLTLATQRSIKSPRYVKVIPVRVHLTLASTMSLYE